MKIRVSQSQLDCVTHSTQDQTQEGPRPRESTVPHALRMEKKRDQPSQPRGEKMNQPPRDLFEDDLLEDAEELLLYHEVGGLEEEDRKGGAQFSRGS